METGSPLIAVDTNVLFDLANGEADALDALSIIRKRIPHADIVITSTVIEEMAYAADFGGTQEIRTLATKALTNLQKWGIRPCDFKPVGHGITEKTAERIRQAGLVPEEEINDSFVIAEAALAECRLLISTDSHIADIDQATLSAVLVRCDVPTPSIVSPRKIVRDFFPKR